MNSMIFLMLAASLVFQGVRFVFERRLLMRVNTIWQFMYRRGIAEALTKNLLDKDLRISDERAREAYSKLSRSLKAISADFTKFGQDWESQMAFRIEQELGDTLAAEVCPRLGIAEGACLALAVALVKETKETKG